MPSSLLLRQHQQHAVLSPSIYLLSSRHVLQLATPLVILAALLHVGAMTAYYRMFKPDYRDVIKVALEPLVPRRFYWIVVCVLKPL